MGAKGTGLPGAFGGGLSMYLMSPIPVNRDETLNLQMDSVVSNALCFVGGDVDHRHRLGSSFPNNNSDSALQPQRLPWRRPPLLANLEGTPDTVGVFTGAIYTARCDWVTIPFLGANSSIVVTSDQNFEGYTLTIKTAEPIQVLESGSIEVDFPAQTTTLNATEDDGRPRVYSVSRSTIATGTA